jgi:hypothetical protein
MLNLMIGTLDLFFTRKQMLWVVDTMMTPLHNVKNRLKCPRPEDIITAEELRMRLNGLRAERQANG